ncbi:unnamed protein product [Linum trigynum]|uniref:F-box domain-containing protein n=1 Tax=Linum trigynum TaxID=586398 RepID=A0AAV2D0U1_9ROSI
MAATESGFFTEQRREEELDSTVELPDELVVNFLSSLTLKEAVRTSVLSRKWINLWKSSNLVLDFDAMEELIAIHMSTGKIQPLLKEKRRWLKNWVNGVVGQLQEHNINNALTLKKFRVVFNFTKQCNSEGDIDRWVEFAISKRVESLDLHFDTQFMGNAELYDFSEDVYNHIKTPAGLLDIKPLKSLRLCCVEVKREVLEHFISNCPLLEELAVERTDFLKKLRVVGSSGSPLRLKYLELRHCEILESLEIDHTPFLERLIYDKCDTLMEWRVGKCPSLVQMILGFGLYWDGYNNVVKALYGCVSQLEHLLVKTFAVGRLFEDVAEHTRLERLTVEAWGGGNNSLLELVPLINACPRLHTLQVFMHTYNNEQRTTLPQTIVKMQRESIKVVEIIGFRGFSIECELVEYVMEYFVALERMVVDRAVGDYLPCEGVILGGRIPKLCTEEEAMEAEKLALEFKLRARPTLEFVVI